VVIYVKLLSNKGLAFTAGVINVTAKDYLQMGENFTLKLNKSLDFDAYCDCRRLDILASGSKKNDKDFNIDKFKTSSFQLAKKESVHSSEQEKSKVSRELIAFKNDGLKE
jgi:hypothetical protein